MNHRERLIKQHKSRLIAELLADVGLCIAIDGDDQWVETKRILIAELLRLWRE